MIKDSSSNPFTSMVILKAYLFLEEGVSLESSLFFCTPQNDFLPRALSFLEEKRKGP